MGSRLTTAITQGIRVTVSATYMQQESSPKHDYHVFAYQVEIRNESNDEVQLIAREWRITDGYGKTRTVKGEGVVGKKPHLAPGESYRYVSGAHFKSLIGKMDGHYTMVRKSGTQHFQVQIPPFVMTVPFVMN